MYLQNHTHLCDEKPEYFKVLEIVGFSSLSFILGILYQKMCNGTRLG